MVKRRQVGLGARRADGRSTTTGPSAAVLYPSDPWGMRRSETQVRVSIGPHELNIPRRAIPGGRTVTVKVTLSQRSARRVLSPRASELGCSSVRRGVAQVVSLSGGHTQSIVVLLAQTLHPFSASRPRGCDEP